MKTVSLAFCLPPFCSNPNLSFGPVFGGQVHSLQHTAASILLNNGRNYFEVSKMLGHSQPSTTMNIYAHLIPVMHNDKGDFMDELVTPIPIEIGKTSNQTMVETGKLP